MEAAMLIRRRGLLGSATRGKTAPNRLRRTDTFLLVAYPERVRASSGLFVDLGFGAAPVTSVETLARLSRLNPRLRVVGVEIDSARVAAAQPFAGPRLQFRLGGFDLPLDPGERVAFLRAFNVLRQYPEEDVPGALRALSRHLVPGGLVLEGTSDPTGRLLAFLVHERRAASPDPPTPAVRRAPEAPWPGRPRGPGRGAAGHGEGPEGLDRAALVFAPRLRDDFSPRTLQAVLPKSFIHQAAPGGAVDRFFAAWDEGWRRARPAAPARRFAGAAAWLAGSAGYRVDPRPALLRRGFLVLGPEWPALRGPV
jgi:hypothetical protein